MSREILQNSGIVRSIRKQIIKKTLDLLNDLAKNKTEDYKNFWNIFGPVVKEGLALDPEYKDRIAELVRFESSKDGIGLTSLAEYVSRMQEKQDVIYFITDETRKSIEAS